MAYQVLARKWRPKTFADLVGQEHVVQALRNALERGRIHHAYLLTGTRGVGKTTIARILAKSLNCETPQAGEPCGVCPVCTAIEQGRFVDVLEIDAASNTGIDNIREVLENAQYAPTAGRYKVYIIDEVHMLSKAAFNAMLKTLEEPPEHVKFILATTDPHKVPVTVLSRCLQFVLRNMTAAQVAAHLERVLDAEGIAFENDALALIGRAAGGSMRDALSLLDQAIALGKGQVSETDVRQMIGAVDKAYLYRLLRALVSGDGAVLMAEAEQMAASAAGFDHALNELALLLQRLALWKRVPSAFAADDPDRSELAGLAAALGEEEIQLYYQCAVHGKRDLPLAPDEYAGFVMTLLRMLAFAPLAAADYPVEAEISGTDLSDPPPKEQFTGKSLAQPFPEPAVPVPEKVAVVAAAVADAVGVERERRVAEAPVDAGAADRMATDAEAVVGDAAGESASGYRRTPVAATGGGGEQTVDEGVAEGTVQGGACRDAVPDLPPLTAENWVDIAEILIGSGREKAAFLLRTGLNRMAFVAWDEDSGRLTLAVDQAAAGLPEQRKYLGDLAARLGQAYGCPLHIVLADWSAVAEPDTVESRRIRRSAKEQESIQAVLEADSAAKDILRLFDGSWLPESLVRADAVSGEKGNGDS